MVQRDIVIGALVMALSAAFFVGTWSFADHGEYVSPRVFPRVVSGCMLLLACLLTVRSVVARVRAGRPQRAPFDTHAFVERWWRLAAAAGVAFLYTELIDTLGYLVCTGVFLAAMVALFRETRLAVVVPVAAIGTGVLYWLFRMVFKVPLPRLDLFDWF